MLNIILGGAGLIGTNLCSELNTLGEKVIICDNLSNSRIEDIPKLPEVHFIKVDCLDFESLLYGLTSFSLDTQEIRLWHFAANSDIAIGTKDMSIDFLNTLGTTISSLKLAEHLNISQYIFASSSAIYGTTSGVPFREDNISFNPISSYGVMKLASEKLIEIFSKKHSRLKVRIYRFPNVIGLPLTHGVIKDLFNKLILKPEFLYVLGDGNQSKPFMHVEDLVKAMIYLNNQENLFEIFNLGPSDDNIKISNISESLRDTFSPNTKILYESKSFGWEGDVPTYSFDTSKANLFGLLKHENSKNSVNRVIKQLEELFSEKKT
jgi:UDP-glucose 4-epimerase